MTFAAPVEASEQDDLRRQLADARREAVYGVARVAGSFATDLAEAREGLRILAAALEAHVQRHGDPDSIAASDPPAAGPNQVRGIFLPVIDPDESFKPFRLRGGRFNESQTGSVGYPVEALAELARYERLLQQVARGLWKNENRARVRAPRNFKNSLRLRLIAIEQGCVIPVLDRGMRRGEPGQLFPTPDEWIERAVHAIADAIAAVVAGRVPPPDFPSDALDGLESFGSGLRDDEEVVMDRNGADEVIIYSQRVRHSLIRLRHEHDVEISGELIGRLSEVDGDKQGFQFTDRSGRRVPGAFSRRGLYASIHRSTDRTQDAPFVRLTCTYLTDLQGKVTSVQDVDEVEILVGADDRLGPRLRALLALPGSWRDGEGLPLKVEAIEWVRDFVAEVEEEEASRLSLFPTLEGGVLVERQIGARRWSLEVSEDGDVSVTVVSNEGPAKSHASDSPSAVASLRAFVHD